FDAGTMCPSYRVTRDEVHVTRGRANTLRLALSGQLGSDAFTSDAVAEAMALCVGCKGCKRECPTGVDMARLKIEFTAQYKQRHGFTLKDRLLAGLPQQAHRAAAIPGLAALLNLRNASPLLRRLGERLMGVTAQRALPAFRRDTFWRSPGATPFVGRDEALAAARAGSKVAVLFVDSFTGGFETENAHAAAAVLHAAGYALHTVIKAGGHHCCGRTQLAAGMVDEARSSLSALLDALLPLAEAGIAVVGLEPSCLLTLRDEALALKLGVKAETVAAQALLFEEFIAREVKAGRFSLALKALDRPLLVHGHCHQKAFGAVSTLLDVLKLIPGAQPQLIESSCCGMAGSFGYEAQHQAVSMQMAEATLLPAIRQQPDAVVVADGTSCRHQIADGAQRQAVHAARLLASLL
ncbi:MAG: 4Fe-4S dicluster domain-containing protein, partial [Rubrivivax sp.]|nr:4Fe-4S dicluster domain-containing protein [Rubrivivax sp.]